MEDGRAEASAGQGGGALALSGGQISSRLAVCRASGAMWRHSAPFCAILRHSAPFYAMLHQRGPPCLSCGDRAQGQIAGACRSQMAARRARGRARSTSKEAHTAAHRAAPVGVAKQELPPQR